MRHWARKDVANEQPHVSPIARFSGDIGGMLGFERSHCRKTLA